MQLTSRVPLGDNQVMIEADGLKQLFMACGFFAKIPQKCGNCNSTNLVLAGHKNSGYEFFNVLCMDCKYELKFGQKKEDNSLFLRDDTPWTPPYEGGGGGGGGQQQYNQQPPPQQQQPYNQQPPQQQHGGGPAPTDDIPF